MEHLRQVSNTQFVFTAAAVMVVLLCAGLVFVFGFHSTEQPHFGKLPIIIDDRKSSNKKKKIKEKKPSPNRATTEENKTKSEGTKKSPVKEKKEEKPKDALVKPKEKLTQSKSAHKELSTETKKSKNKVDTEKPEDYDDSDWQKVPKKSEKKKVKAPEEKDKKESPAKKQKKKKKEADAEVVSSEQDDSSADRVKIVSAEGLNEEAARILQAQVEEFQRVLKEAELRDKGIYSPNIDEPLGEVPTEDENTEVKDLRSNKKKQQIEKQIKKKASEMIAKTMPVQEAVENENDASKLNQNVPVFDELGDTWNDAKPQKKSKKKARKDQ